MSVVANPQILCVIVHYNRPDMLSALLSDMARNKRDGVRVRVYDDSSSADLAEPKAFCDENGFELRTVSGGPHGRERFWQLWCEILGDLKKEPKDTLFCMLPDDVRLCENFFDRCVELWNARPNRDDGTVTIHVDKRVFGSNWTGFKAQQVSDLLWQTQWVDGAFLCQHGALRRIDYTIPAQPKGRFAAKHVSSGVWSHVSNTLHNAKQTMYQSAKSLIVHMVGTSVMHPETRAKDPMSTIWFVDGDNAQRKLLFPSPAEASLASIPDRESMLQKVVSSLLPQVDKLRVYLNNYHDVPSFLSNPKIVVARSQDHGDLGDAGKFFWCDDDRGYQLTCDDDFVYPEDYVVQMIQGIERHRKKAVVSLHGSRLVKPITSYYRSRNVCHWKAQLDNDTEVDVLGTGVMAYHASTIDFRLEMFKLPNMADVWASIACERVNVPRIVLAHKAGWLAYLGPEKTIYDAHLGRDTAQTEAVRSVNWSVKKNTWTAPLCEHRDAATTTTRDRQSSSMPTTPPWSSPSIGDRIQKPTCAPFMTPQVAPQSHVSRPAPVIQQWPSEQVKVALDGFKYTLECDSGHVITRHLNRTKMFYEADLLQAIRKHQLEGIYIDAGANIGNHSVWFALACKSTRVMSFEPSPRYYRLLLKNTSGLSKVQCFDQAVAAKDGLVKVTGVTGRPVPDPVLELPAKTLDELCFEQGKVAFIKVDVDGDDIGVLRGAEAIIGRDRPWISVECFTPQHRSGLDSFCSKNRYRQVGTYCYTPTAMLAPC